MSSTATLVMKNDLREIERMAVFVQNFGEGHGFTKEDIFALNLAIEELMTNTILYGYPEGGIHQLTLDLGMEQNICQVVLSDDALAYNPLNHPGIETNQSLEEKAVGGLGIHLAKKMVDQLCYERQEERNIISLHRRIGTRQSAS